MFVRYYILIKYHVITYYYQYHYNEHESDFEGCEMECEFSVRERSLEEEDELQRSTKKVKEATMGSTFGTNVSYKDKLVGEMPGAFAQAFNLSSEEAVSDEPSLDVEGLHKGLLSVKLSFDMRKQIRAKWAFSLIVKVVGRTVGFHFLRNRVMSL